MTPASSNSSESSGRPAGRRLHTWWRRLSGKAWALGVNLRKQVVYWQDRLGLYSYSAWIRRVEQPAIRAALAEPADFRESPLHLAVCFVIAGEVEPPALERTLESLKAQAGLDWTLALAAPAGSAARLRASLSGEPRARVVESEDRPGAEDGLACVPPAVPLELPAAWYVPLAAGDRLSPHWAALVRRALALHPRAEILYWDEDGQSASGRRAQPCFKPGWSPELLFARNDFESAAFCRRVLVEGRERGSAAGIFSATRAAREIVHLPLILQHRAPGWAESLGARLARHARVVREYLAQRGAQEIAVEQRPGSLHARWKVDQPPVTIIIPTRNNLAYLRRCLTTLLEKTQYPRYDIVLMDDHSSDPAVLDYYKELRSEVPNLRIQLNEAGPFNYSRVNNRGARLASGELLLFLNNDVEILTAGWLAEMVRWAQEPGVGMVGARLRYPDGAIQHAGIVIGMTGHANHVYAGKLPVQGEHLFPFPSPDTLRNVSAVTGACMLVRRAVFEQVGGFNEDLSLVFNDVELGLRVVENGWRVVYAPAAELIHYEGRSRARYIPPANIRLGADLLRDAVRAGDRYYNPNLSTEVSWPTLRRASQPGRLWMLDQIVRYKGDE